MASTSPARIDDDLYASAKLAGAVQSRSASQQVAHWARIGREIEASQSISSKEIGAVLAGARSYDSLDPKEQALVRAEWAARMDELRADVDLAASFRDAGQTWVELDADGKVVERSRRKSSAAKPRTGAKKTAKTRAQKTGTQTKTAIRTMPTKKATAQEAGTKRVRAAG